MADSSEKDGPDAAPTARTRRITFKTESGLPVSLFIGTRFADRETFMRRFAPMVGPGGMFVVTQSIRRVGDRLSFAVTLADETAMLEGEVEVLEVRSPDPARPERKGMRLRFLQLSPKSQEIVDEMVRLKRETGARTDPSFGVAGAPIAADSSEPQGAATPPGDAPSVDPTSPLSRATSKGMPTSDRSPGESAHAPVDASRQLTLIEAPAPTSMPASMPASMPTSIVNESSAAMKALGDEAAFAVHDAAPPLAQGRPRPPTPPPAPHTSTDGARPLPVWFDPSAAEPPATPADAPPGLDVTLDLRPSSDGGARAKRDQSARSEEALAAPPAALPFAPSFGETSSTSGPESSFPVGSRAPGRSTALTPPSQAPPFPPPIERRKELRAPGSPLIVEANPLADIDDDLLRSFIDDMLLDGTRRQRSPSLLGLKPFSEAVPPDDEPPAQAAMAATMITAAPAPLALGDLATPTLTPAVAPARDSPPTLIAAAPAVKRTSSLFLVVAATATISLAVGIGLALFVRASKGPPPVAAAPPVAPAPRERVVEKSPVVLPPAPPPPSPAPSLCTVDVTSNPTGFHVRWNGEDRGITPATLTNLPCGESGELSLGGGRYRPFDQRVTPRADSPSRVAAKLIAAPPRLLVWSRPDDAEVTLDGKKAGRTPYQVEVRSGAEIKVEIERAGFKPWSSTVLLRNQFNQVSVVLEPLPAP